MKNVFSFIGIFPTIRNFFSNSQCFKITYEFYYDSLMNSFYKIFSRFKINLTKKKISLMQRFRRRLENSSLTGRGKKKPVQFIRCCFCLKFNCVLSHTHTQQLKFKVVIKISIFCSSIVISSKFHVSQKWLLTLDYRSKLILRGFHHPAIDLICVI